MSPYSICFAKRPRFILLRSQLPCILCEQRQQSRAASSLLRPPGSPWHCGSSGLLPGHATEPEQLIDWHSPGAWETKNSWYGVVSTEKAQGIEGGPKEKQWFCPKHCFDPLSHVGVQRRVGEGKLGELESPGWDSDWHYNPAFRAGSMSSAVFRTGVTATFTFKYSQWTWNQLRRCLWTSRVC